MSESTLLRQIPLNKLSPSSLNVRKTDRKADIDALAASILAHGLLQNLNVVTKDGEKFEVVAGGRRLAALKALAKTGAIPRDYPVSCKEVADAQAREASLAENIQRVDMDAMDEVDAYAQLVDEGATAEDVARRFGVTLRHVQQRLALAKLSSKIKAAWKRGEVTLDAARAFCLVDDHAQQEAVFRSLSKPIAHASTVRARLMGDRMRARDRLASFVGLEAYEVAGGAIVRDLFDEDAVYIGDPALMTQLAEAKLETHRGSFIDAGWGWVELNLAGGSVTGTRIQPDWRDPTPEEEVELARLRADLDALDEAIDADSIEEDPRWDRRDDLAGQIETIRQTARVWDPALMSLAGVVLSVSHDGDLNAVCGVVRPGDEKTVREIRKSRQQSDVIRDDGPKNVNADEAASESGLPKTVIRDLSAIRTRALRMAIGRDSRVGLAVAVAALASHAFLRSGLSGVAIIANPAHVEDLDAFATQRSEVEQRLPVDEIELVTWCLDQTSETLLSVLAVLVAGAVDLTHERGAVLDRSRQRLADTLACAVNLDITQVWTSDLDYWARLPKSELLAAMRDAPHMMDLSPQARETALKAHAKLKKDDLAVKTARAFEGTGYLPDLLVTPLPQGAVVLTTAGVATAA